MQSSFRPATRRKWLGEQSEGDRRDGDLKLGWTKPLPSTWPMGIDCWPVFGRGAPGVGSERVGLLCRIAVPGVTYEGAMDGRPFFVVSCAVDPGLLSVLREQIVPRLKADVPNQPTLEQLEADPLLSRFTIVFDREGYS